MHGHACQDDQVFLIVPLYTISKIIDSDAANTPWPAKTVLVRQRLNPENRGNRDNPALLLKKKTRARSYSVPASL